MGILNRVLEHTLRHGLSTVHDRTYFAVVDLYEDDVESARMRLTIALPACDERSKHLIRDALQLLEGIDEDPEEASDAEAQRAVSDVGGGDA